MAPVQAIFLSNIQILFFAKKIVLEKLATLSQPLHNLPYLWKKYLISSLQPELQQHQTDGRMGESQGQ
jgi:hypothetical protein